VYDQEWLQRLDDFAALFREDFRRRDQAHWASIYLQGLLNRDIDRKAIGTLARHVRLPEKLVIEDVAQALQNFINQSPWDEKLVCQRLRRRLAEAFADSAGSFLVDEIAIEKQGRHSVGVQRQFSSMLGRKTNCQVAVILYHCAREAILPLGLRLYLPRNWLAGAPESALAGVPESYRQPRSKSAIARELLEETRADGWDSYTLVCGSGLRASPEFRETLRQLGFIYLTEADAAQSPENGEYVTAVDYLTNVVSNAALDDSLRQAWSATSKARELARSLLHDFGLNDFEGRSWRGFHHHACMVQLAQAFQTLEKLDPRSLVE
jgi:SRSO17 transposase